MQEKNYPNLRGHSATLKLLYYIPHRRLPQSFTHNPNKRKKKSRNFPGARRPQHDRSEPGPRVSRARASRTRAPPVTLSECSPHSRALPLSNSGLVPASPTQRQPRALSPHTHTPSLKSAFSTSVSQRPSARPLSSAFLTHSLSARLLRTAPRPLLSFATP